MSWVHSQFSGPADHGVWLYDPLRRTDTWRCYGQSSMFKIQLARMVWTSMDSLCSSICLNFCNTAGHESFTAHQTSSFLWRVLHYTRHLVMNATGSFERSPVNSGMPLLHPYATWMTIPFSGFVPPGTTNAVDKQQAKEEFLCGSFFLKGFLLKTGYDSPEKHVCYHNMMQNCLGIASNLLTIKQV